MIVMTDKDVIFHFISRLSEYPVIKTITGFFLWIAKALFGPIFRAAYGAVGILYILDFIAGYSYAWMNPQIKPDSRRMFHGLVKLLIYLLLLIVGYQASSVMFGSFIQSVIEAFVVLTEVKSILENIKKIADLKGVHIPFLDALTVMVQGKLNETIQRKG